MGKKLLTEKSVVFYKIYGVNVAITVVFIVLLSLICGAAGSRMILGNMMRFNQEKMMEKGSILDERLKQLEESVNVIIGNEAVFKFLMAEDPEKISPMELLKIIRSFQNMCSNSSLLDGISLIDKKSGMILTEKTRLNLQEGWDFNGERKQDHFAVRKNGGKTSLFFLKYFEPILGKKQVYLVITVNQAELTKGLMTGAGVDGMACFLLTEQGEFLPCKKAEGLNPFTAAALRAMKGMMKKLDTTDRSLILYKRLSTFSDLTLTGVQDYTFLSRDAQNVTRLIFGAGIFMVLTASVIIWLCTLYAYRPLKQLSGRIQTLARAGSPVRVKEKKREEKKREDRKWEERKQKNEYSLIEEAVSGLELERISLMKQYDAARPSLIRDTVNKLLSELYDEERFQFLKRITGLEMQWDTYALVIAECMEKEEAQAVSQCFYRFFNQEEEVEGCFMFLTECRGGGVMNTCLSYEEFLERMKGLKGQLDEAGVTLTLCISKGFKLREHMSLIYADALKTLERKFFQGTSALIYDMAPAVGFKSESYSKRTEASLTKWVTEGKREEAREALNDLTRSLMNDAADIQYTRFIYFQICSNLIQSVLELGGLLPKSYKERDIFKKVFCAKTIQELKELAEEILDVCVKNFSQGRRKYSQSVEKAIGYIEENYGKGISLDDVAGAVYLSAGYLSYIFKEETGYTVLEHITNTRMKAAKVLLLEIPVIKVQDVAGRVGYQSVQSFIRSFKKHYGITPMEFRKKM